MDLLYLLCDSHSLPLPSILRPKPVQRLFPSSIPSSASSPPHLPLISPLHPPTETPRATKGKRSAYLSSTPPSFRIIFRSEYTVPKTSFASSSALSALTTCLSCLSCCFCCCCVAAASGVAPAVVPADVGRDEAAADAEAEGRGGAGER